jgi:hypothetical protein
MSTRREIMEAGTSFIVISGSAAWEGAASCETKKATGQLRLRFVVAKRTVLSGGSA